jgi:hypothetical protein
MNFSGIIGVFTRLLTGRGKATAKPVVRPASASKAGARPAREAAKRSRKAAQMTHRRGR